MAVTITNRANQLLILQLNDGQALYLAPGETSRALEELQVSGNDKVAKLTRENLVALASKKEAPKAAAPKVAPKDSAPGPPADAAPAGHTTKGGGQR